MMNGQPDTEAFGGDNINLWGNLINVIFVLAIIIFLIVVLVRFLGKRNRLFSQSRSIRTMGAIGLGPNKSLQVIEIGSSIYLVGVGEDISLIDKVSDPEEVSLIQLAFEDDETQFSSLSSVVSNMTSRFKRGNKNEFLQEEEELNEASFSELFQSQLQKFPNRRKKLEELLRDQEEQSTDDRSRDS